MSSFCLMPKLAEKLKQAIVDGKIDIEKLSEMTSKERRNFFTEFFGNEATAKEVNALFESKLLLKNQVKGIVNWAKQVTGIKPEVKRDLISRIEKMDKLLNPEEQRLFLEDLASKRLGTDISIEEADEILKLSNKIKDSTPGTLEYGVNKRFLEKYVSELRVESEKLMFKDYLKNPGKFINFLGGLTKSLRATFDNSFIGRQGIKVLFTNPKIWAKNAAKSFDIINRTIRNNPSIKGLDETDAILADIYSRENFSKMKKAKLDIGTGEEAFPSSVPEKIPLIKRLFKASESAYTGTAYKMRADLFDKYIEKSQKNGVNIEDKFYLESLGILINSMTGRGRIKYLSLEGQKAMNNLLFSGKFLKSNIDTLTAHSFQKIHPEIRKEAVKNLAKIIGSVGSILLVADTLKPGSVEWDSTSSDFGKIKIGDTRFDITGGMGSIVVLVSRILKQQTKSTSTGKINKLGTDFGEKSGSDLIWDFSEGKLAPLASVVKQLFIDRAGYMGKELKPGDLLSSLFVPMPITNLYENLNNPNSAPVLLTIMADGLGISANTYTSKNKKTKQTVRVK